MRKPRNLVDINSVNHKRESASKGKVFVNRESRENRKKKFGLNLLKWKLKIALKIFQRKAFEYRTSSSVGGKIKCAKSITKYSM